VLRAGLLWLSEQPRVFKFVRGNGLARRFAARFVAGETVDDAVAALKQLNAAGISASLDLLGEAVGGAAEARAARDVYLQTLDRIHRARADSHVSVKLTQMGLDISQLLSLENLLRILDKAKQIDQFVRLDMESSRHTEDTLRIFEHVWQRGFTNSGIVLQAYLYRTARDVEWAIELGCRVRLCKGAYAEPPSLAFPDKRDVDANYLKLARRLLDAGHFPALATHDLRIIREVESWHPEPRSFEFQMLYGVRSDLQRQLANTGWGMRAYVPFGSDWYAYFMRRLAERPANLLFFLQQLKDYLPHHNGNAAR